MQTYRVSNEVRVDSSRGKEPEKLFMDMSLQEVDPDKYISACGHSIARVI